MTHELQEQIKEVAEYVGAKPLAKDENWYTNVPGYPKDTVLRITSLELHSRIEWIWPVAKKVCEELITIGTANRTMYTAKYLAIHAALTDFDLPALFLAVYNAIKFLNEIK